MRYLIIALSVFSLSLIILFSDVLGQDDSIEIDTYYTTTATAADVLAGKTFITRTAGHGDRGVTGIIPTQTLSALSTAVSAGYYEATTLDAIDQDLVAGNIKSGITIFGITGTYVGRNCIYGIPKTGQTVSYEKGDDGYYQKGAPVSGPRFTDNKDGTITDNATGLMWAQSGYADADTSPATPYTPDGAWRKYTWEDALFYCSRLNDKKHFPPNGYLGHNDWRLPNINELLSIINYSNWGPAIGETTVGKFGTGVPFANTAEPGCRVDYWSSTTSVDDLDRALTVDFYDGVIFIPGFKASIIRQRGITTTFGAKPSKGYVRPVRNISGISAVGSPGQDIPSQVTSPVDNSKEVSENYVTTANAEDVLAGKTFITHTVERSYRGVTGTIPTQTLLDSSITVNAGYYTATTLKTIDPDLTPGNIKFGVTIFGVAGTFTGTGNGGSYGIPKTGQTTNYQAGDDGYYKKGAPASGSRFTDNKDGTITDNATGLMWIQSGLANANVFPSVSYIQDGLWRKYTWQDAVLYCNRLNNKSPFQPNGYLGHSDWRLPNINELRSIVNYGNQCPVIGEETVGRITTKPYMGTGTPFTNTLIFHGFKTRFITNDDILQTSQAYPLGGTGLYMINNPPEGSFTNESKYWSSTTDAGNISNAWFIDFSSNFNATRPKAWLLYVRPVRDLK